MTFRLACLFALPVLAHSAHGMLRGGDKLQEAGANTTVPQGAQIAPFGKEDTARELQSHAARTQDTLVDAVENAEVSEIKRS
eukprot:CAMPEP_0197874862 /NCGR_PEP_ID=MMETSP1439-20131203/4266_1 /TAXON_ID=66791 /ORGANISM="Gonyaulax spinifera, Strain CCMP409" /LENGTH=81 /DNA_ID=CAMNT_0043494023 /DNA_START=38 /DNA_END=280 /DNA_ORIENTATION=+